MWSYLLITVVLSAGLQADKEINPEKLIESRCLKNVKADKDAMKKIREAAENFDWCNTIASHRLRSRDDTTDPYCSTSYKNCYGLLEYYVNKIEPCLNVGERYLPKFVLDCYNATADMKCRDGYTKARISAIESANCTQPVQTIQISLIETCLKKLEHLERLNEPDYVLTISDFCSAIPTLKECAVDIVKTKCQNNENLIVFIAGDYKAALDWCNNETSGNIV